MTDEVYRTKDEVHGFCVMQRYGKNLNYCLESRGYQISKESVFNLGLQLLNILEQIHSAGYVYNDLKLDNILLGHGQKLPADCSYGNCFEDIDLTLVDFGFATRYINKRTRKHEPETLVD
jgi:serine/threonine protein kinase